MSWGRQQVNKNYAGRRHCVPTQSHPRVSHCFWESLRAAGGEKFLVVKRSTGDLDFTDGMPTAPTGARENYHDGCMSERNVQGKKTRWSNDSTESTR